MSLRDALQAVAPDNPVVSAIGIDAGPTAAVRVDVDVSTVADAVAVQGTVTGPGAAQARMLDLPLDLGDAVLVSMRGGRFEASYPPEAFAPIARSIHPRLEFPWADRLSTIELGSRQGRSSDGDMPFFLIADSTGRHGIWIALGWSGQWRATFRKETRSARHRLVVEGPGAGMTLADREQLVLPRVVIGAFEGDGWGAIRRHLGATAPARHTPWVVYNSWFNEDARITEDRLLGHLAVAADLGFDAFCVDAAWYETPGDDPSDFQTRGIGTWEVDARKLPGGFERVAKEVHSAGLLFGVWFEPERAHPDSAVWRDHPDWIRTAPGEEWGLVDFGVPAARAWVLDLLSSAVDRWSLDWIKWDMNIQDVVSHWGGDERAELAHVRGVWDVMDELRHRHPDLVLEGCASGGNRIDIEMLNRCHTYWISDQTISPDIVRATMAGARNLLPAQYCYLSLAPQLDDLGVDDYPDEWFVGNMSGVLGVMDRLSTWSPRLRERARAHIRRFKQIRHLHDGEYIRFADDAAVPLAGWEAWELSDPVTGEAALLAMRLASPDESRVFHGRHEWTVTLPPGGATVIGPREGSG